MMNDKVRAYNLEVMEFMDEVFRQNVDARMIANANDAEFALLTRAVRLLTSSCDLLLEQAEWCDRIEGKIDKLLAPN